ncbi:alpha/beta hydrolase [Cyanobium sp. NIES-981]|uniref:alpha/beta hydrolase n=1 Tax=Cyanobium sp. NIES-981 TaxID=1851505 RepID=UPI0007DDE574|nr:esterase [Cyanobium sp. NIES-981]SBO43695.1 Esterase [Cyanobium sp. NIES-981]
MADASPPFSPAAPQPSPGALHRGPERAERRLVLLHGWGADADDLLDLGSLLVDDAVSVVALRAPGLHPSGLGRQWYDLQQPGWPGLPEALQRLRQRLLTLDQQVPLNRSVLLGFSQGAAMAVDVVTRQGDLPVAALIGCSGYPHPDWSPAKGGPTSPSVVLTHGRQDPVVPYGASEELARQLQSRGYSVQLLEHPGGHSIDEQVLPRLRQVIEGSWC